MEVMGVDVWVLMVLMEASPGFDGGFSLGFSTANDEYHCLGVYVFAWVLGVGPFGFSPSLPFGSVVPAATFLCRWVGVSVLDLVEFLLFSVSFFRRRWWFWLDSGGWVRSMVLVMVMFRWC
ncbi:hypothetical protein P8452_74396 [Trifolium repens]|nr:hypothetical protein P8452_74396 [Trifolium repens]